MTYLVGMDFRDLKNRRKLIDRRALTVALDELMTGDTPEGDRRPERVRLFRQALKAGYDEVRHRFKKDQDGEAAATGNAFVVDQLIRCLYDFSTRHMYPSANPTESEKLCIVAVGGYGRGELAPKSDVDLLFLYSYKLSARVEQVVEEMLYTLWDLGLKVGHATRSAADCVRLAKADDTIRTALLERRYIWGQKSFFTELGAALTKGLQDRASTGFLEAKLAERDKRHERMGDSRYVLEPNIKDGKGGLRDLHTLFWIAKDLYAVGSVTELVDKGVLTAAEVKRFAKAQRYLWTLRCHLHYLTDRAEERLTFDVQPELARRMGYTDHAGTLGVERFMKHYFLIAKDVGDLTRIFCAAIEAQHKKRPLLSMARLRSDRDVEGFVGRSGWLTMTTKDQFKQTPADMIRLFDVAQRTGIGIHPDALKSITRNLSRINQACRDDPDANRHFLAILSSPKNPEGTLRKMNECGLFGRFVPDFGRVVAQMQYDMYHVYTTDEHTIRAIGIISRIENGELEADHPLSTRIIKTISSREVLYVAVLLHDIAKGRGGDHSVIGADVARELCPRLGLSEEQTETVAWLVLHHLAMSEAAFKRDIDDPKTIVDFASLVQSVQRLRLLTCLTVADIRAVGPNVWNNWKASLLRKLYDAAEDVLSQGLDVRGHEERVAAVREDLAARLSTWPEEARDRHIARLPAGYLLANDLPHLAHQAEIVAEAERHEQPLGLNVRVLDGMDVTEVTIAAPDHPGLFSRLAGALAVCGATIVDAKIATFNDGLALDVFTVQDIDGGAFRSSAKTARLSVRIDQILGGKVKPLEELEKQRSSLPSRTDVFLVPPRVIIDNEASNTHSVVEVNGRDRPGLLYRVTNALFKIGLQISTAKISTFGEQVVDVFYIKDVFGMKVTHAGKLRQIQETLLDVLKESDPSQQQATGGPVDRRDSATRMAVREEWAHRDDLASPTDTVEAAE